VSAPVSALPSPSKSALPARPSRLGRYDVLAKIASGGMASIYLGRAIDGPREVVALKVMRFDRADQREDLESMFLDEANLIARLRHSSIVRTLEVGVDFGQRYIAMELLSGMTLASVFSECVARGRKLDSYVIAWIGARIAEGLYYAHELRDDHGVHMALIHRDVNPANVFVTFEGSIKLFDFGMAKTMMRTSLKTAPGVVKGKLSYLAPEQIMQLPLDHRADVFGLGTTLWELCTMKRLFLRESDVETVRAVHVGPIPNVRTLAAEVPEDLAMVVARALERNRDHRYSTALELARDLHAIVTPPDVAVPKQLEALLDELFPEERKRQRGWLKPAVSKLK
jgi:serine/threonine-protein kinase